MVTEHHQMCSERRVCFVLGAPILPCGRRAKSSFEESGQVTADDGSDKQGKMGAGYNNLRRKKKKQQCNHHRLNWISFETLKEFIRNTKRELYDEKLEDALEMLDLE